MSAADRLAEIEARVAAGVQDDTDIAALEGD
ncbi:hypothetical protein FB473_003213 [Brooklawnia cerclae]|uniref:Uncharacterized protein n=1 Tax=Brooklawnia cerclae TaxID=349934 RepID=A0ABX0SJB0_9ACTN|nr:hypothetical protein [Brooklawnia cerclae]NIH58518.1 hypothetical protein [Brooklawnia cerclae]